jgi:hypothetical protein
MNPFRSRSSRATNPFRNAATQSLARMGGAPKWFRAGNPLPVTQKIREAVRTGNVGPAYHYGRWTTTPPGTSQASPGIQCWGPGWDQSCKVCAPLPSGGETCSYFKVNDSH